MSHVETTIIILLGLPRKQLSVVVAAKQVPPVKK